MPTINVKTNLSSIGDKLRDMERHTPNMITDVIHETTAYIFRMSQWRCPVVTGTLKKSGFLVLTTDFVGVFGYTAPYALYVEYGTRPHEIRSKKGGVLAWQPKIWYSSRKSGKSKWKRGNWVFIPQSKQPIKHPGTQAQPFVRNSIQDGMTAMPKIVKEVFDEYKARMLRK